MSGELARLRARVARLTADAPVVAVRARLSVVGEGRQRTAVGQVNAEIGGRRVRVQVAAQQLRAAADRLASRLGERVPQALGGWSPRAWTGTQTPTGPVAPAITRVKTPELVWCDPDAAVMTMDAMDYDVHLFTDPETEADAVVYRGPFGYRLTRILPAGRPVRTRIPLTEDAQPAPRLTDAQALARLRESGLAHLFYADPAEGYGRVLYRRYAGGFGLIAGAS
ncbi:sigma 54 modulation/S30EA ribosomal C-terminal domain-containing protein [Streptacidiphilus monticola]|uniref:Sigma 54 modulation/S30EA ribosomal C-terminal domain-containing protein n=1 Tax=Streptacidiphilus monticola TaxID=2161674 RepID=A0ABW1G5K5_9ACTN